MDAIYEYILGRLRLRAALTVALSSDDLKSWVRHSGQVGFCKEEWKLANLDIHSTFDVHPFTYPGQKTVVNV